MVRVIGQGTGRALWIPLLLSAVFISPLAHAAGNVDDILGKARQAIDSEQLDAALDLLKSATPESPKQAARVDVLIGEIFLKVGKPARAMDFFEHAANSTLDDTDAYVGMATAALKQGKVGRARRHAETALRADADLAGAHLVLALADDLSGNVDGARARFEALTRTRPENEEIALAHGEFLFNRGDIEPALQRLERFTAMNEKSGAAHDTLGRYYWAVGRHDDGLRLRALAATIFLAQGNTYRADPIIQWVKLRDPSGTYVKGIESPGLLYKAAPAPAPQPLPPPVPEPVPAPKAETAPPVPPTRPVPGPTLIRLEPLPIPPGAAYSQGTGFVVGDGRYVVTNRHVIHGATDVAVRNGIGQVRRARVVKVGSKDDLAVLELESAFPSDQSIATAAMGDPRPGRAAIVLGFPMAGILGEQMPSMTNGVVSKTTGFQNDPATFLMSTKVNKGNSGGPVFDDRGNLIGVVVSKLDALKIYEKRGFMPEDVNQAIKISRVFELMGWDGGTESSAVTAPMTYEDLYQAMLPKVVIIAALLPSDHKK